jgi:hypothetical protein
MKVAGAAGDDPNQWTDASSGLTGEARHLFEAWEIRPALEVAQDYGRDGIDWAVAVDGPWTGSARLAELGLVLVLARQAEITAGPPLILLYDDLAAVQEGDQISVDPSSPDRVQLDHVDGLTTFLDKP